MSTQGEKTKDGKMEFPWSFGVRIRVQTFVLRCWVLDGCLTYVILKERVWEVWFMDPEARS